MVEWEKLYNEVRKLEHEFGDRALKLEEYLRSLLMLVYQNQDKKPSITLFQQMITQAFETPPIALDQEWMKITDPPIEDYEIEFTESEVELVEKPSSSPEEDLAYLTHALKFQIAELNRMEGKKVGDKEPYFGLESETGHYWNNFDPFGNLESGLRGYIDNIKGGAQKADRVTWKTLAEIIELGRIYE